MRNERSVEIPWLISKLRLSPPSRLLDVGHAEAAYTYDLLITGATCTFHDVRPFLPSFPLPPQPHPHTIITCSPFTLASSFPHTFDTIILLSVLDHVGTPAYDQAPDPNAYPTLIRALTIAARPHAFAYVTTPVGNPNASQNHQIVFDLPTAQTLLPPPHWSLITTDLYLLDPATDTYLSTSPSTIPDATYLYHQGRAQAVACLTFQRLPNPSLDNFPFT